ncbi:MAG: hypothetical protein WC608_01740 [Parcubacteria group bacterium]
MENLIKIEIKDSFNKKDSSYKKDEDISNHVSTLNNTKNILETYSASMGSITGHHFDGSINIVKNQGKGIWREIIIGTASAVFGAIISYFIFGIK